MTRTSSNTEIDLDTNIRQNTININKTLTPTSTFHVLHIALYNVTFNRFNGLIYYCLTSGEPYFSFIQDENTFNNKTKDI